MPFRYRRTKNLAFGVTSSVSYEAPYSLARRFSTLDHLTRGRIGLNIVTGYIYYFCHFSLLISLPMHRRYLTSAAKNFGFEEQTEHDERYVRAEEYVKSVSRTVGSSRKAVSHHCLSFLVVCFISFGSPPGVPTLWF